MVGEASLYSVQLCKGAHEGTLHPCSRARGSTSNDGKGEYLGAQPRAARWPALGSWASSLNWSRHLAMSTSNVHNDFYTLSLVFRDILQLPWPGMFVCVLTLQWELPRLPPCFSLNIPSSCFSLSCQFPVTCSMTSHRCSCSQRIIYPCSLCFM